MPDIDTCRVNLYDHLRSSPLPDETQAQWVLRQVEWLVWGSYDTRAALAKAMGIQPPILSNYLNGSRGSRMPSVAAKLCGLGVDCCPCGDVECGGCEP